MSRQFSGALLRHARIKAGLKRERLALLIGRSVFSVHSYETGRCTPSPAILAAIADALGIAIDDLFELKAVANAAAV